MARIIGNTTATPTPRSDWNQNDATKADYIKNKPTILTEQDVKNILDEESVVTSDDGSISVTGGIEANTITATSELYTQYIEVGDTEICTDEISTTTVFADEFTTNDEKVVIDAAGVTLNNGASISVSGNDATITLNGESVALKSDVPTTTSQLTNDSNYLSVNADALAVGDQVTAKGDYSAAFNKGLIGTEAKASIYGYEINVNEILKKGVDIVAIDTTNNTLDIYGTYDIKVLGVTLYKLTIADAFEYAMGANPHFIVEIAEANRLPVISSEKVDVNGKECARLHIHKAYSVSGVTTSQKITNFYAGYVDAEGAMVVNKLNITLGRGAFSSGYNNLNIADNTHTQNSSNIASGEAGSAAGSLTEAGVTAFSTGHKTKALGESSLTFGIRSETAYTESTEKEGGKGSVAGGYNTRANAPYTAVFGVDTVSNAQGQLVCGLKNKEDANALFIVGQGNSKNAFSVDKTGKGSILNLKVGNDAAEVTGGNGTLGVGNRTKTRGESSVAFGIGSETAETTYGDNAVDGGKGAIAGGYEAKANYRYSQAFGYSTHTDANHQFVCGVRNASDSDALFIVGNADPGLGGEKNGFVVKRSGDGYFGGNVYANNVKLATVNDIPDVPSYDGDVITSNNWQDYIEISAESPISAGTGTGAAVMGDRTSANANYSFAGGESSTTLQNNETDPTKQIKACLAFGISAEAQKNGSVAFGWRTKANCENQLVVGRCNNYENWGNALFVVGNGTSETNRSNALVVHGSGNTYVAGDVYSNNKQLATEEYVNNAIANIEHPEGSSSDMGEWDYILDLDNGDSLSDIQNLSGNVLVKGGSCSSDLEIGYEINHLRFDSTQFTSSVYILGRCNKLSGIVSTGSISYDNETEIEDCVFNTVSLHYCTKVDNIKANEALFRGCEHMKNITIVNTASYEGCRYVDPFTCEKFGSGVPMIDQRGYVEFLESAEGGSYGS